MFTNKGNGHFTDSGIIGSKEFVFTTYQQFKNLFQGGKEKKLGQAPFEDLDRPHRRTR
jgi:hypothetical protein